MRTVRKSWVPSLLVLSIAVLVALASYKKWFESLEYVIYDALVKAHTLTINPDVLIKLN